MQTENVLPIPKDGIARNKKNIDRWLTSLDYEAKGSKERLAGMTPEMQNLFSQYVQAGGTAPTQNMSIVENLKRFSEGSTLLTTHANTVANTIKFGFGLGVTVMEMYEKSSGLASLRQLNTANKLEGSQVTEFQQKQMTGAAIQTFVSAYYIVWELSKYRTDEVADRVLPAIQLPEFTLINAQQAIKFALFYFGKFASSDQLVRDDVALIKFTLEYFKAILNELELYKSSLQYKDEFENRSYKLEDTEFLIRGFKADLSGQLEIVEFKKTKWEEVVGNRDSKHASRRLIQSILCYDHKTQRNPMLDLGGIRTITMGFGEPGTGKSMIAAATATDLDERCKDLKIPFLFWPFPPNPVSEYQGGSAERTLAWFKRLRDTSKIIYAPVDDAENNFVSRGNKNISSGAREVISVYLTETEGSGAVIHGNYAIQLLTNRPEDIDSAVLSRIQGRSIIAGAETWHDFLDQDVLWWKKYNEMTPGFVGLQAPEGYTYFDNQKIISSLKELDAGIAQEVVPQHETVRKIFFDVSQKYDPKKEDQFYGVFYEQIKKAFPFFTSRDVRNIQMAVSERIMDFDFPKEWWDNNAIFFSKSYDEKKKMLIECMKENMKGLSFPQIRLQEAVKYIDITVAIRETKFEASVKELLEQMEINKEATKRFKEKNK